MYLTHTYICKYILLHSLPSAHFLFYISLLISFLFSMEIFDCATFVIGGEIKAHTHICCTIIRSGTHVNAFKRAFSLESQQQQQRARNE